MGWVKITLLDMIGEYKSVEVTPSPDGLSDLELQVLKQLREASEIMNQLHAMQVYKYSAALIEFLDVLEKYVPSPLEKQFAEYHALVKLNFGVHYQSDKTKFIPRGFTFDDIKAQWQEALKEWMGESRLSDLSQIAPNLQDVVFNLEFENKRPAWGNLYRGKLSEGWDAAIREKFAEEVSAVQNDPRKYPILTHQFSITNVTGDGYSITPYSQDKDMGPLIHRANDILLGIVKILNEQGVHNDLALYLKAVALDMHDCGRDFWRSDLAYLANTGRIQLSIGPVETYTEDEFLGQKADFQSVVSIVDETNTERLKKLTDILLGLESNLPVKERQYLHSSAPNPGNIIFSNVLYMAGAAAAGPATLAHSLPNPKEIKDVQTKANNFINLIRIKYKENLVPIMGYVLGEYVAKVYDSALGQVAFEWFIVGHEVSHAFGQAQDDPRKTLTRFYTPIEELKADASSMYNMQYLKNLGIMTPEVYAVAIDTYIAGLFRSMRLGLNRAHGKSNMMQFNYLLQNGGVEDVGGFVRPTDRFMEVLGNMVDEVITIEGRGDAKDAERFTKEYLPATPLASAILERINKAGVPVDICVKYNPL